MKKYFLLSFLFLMSGCATILENNNSKSHVKIIDSQTNQLIQDVECTVRYNFNNSIKFNSPEFFLNSKIDSKDLPHITCHKEGYISKSFQPSSSLNKKTLLNAIVWTPGFIIDGMTGNIKKLKKEIQIKLDKLN
jgi:hypothetical protein